jgi:cytochrome c2
MLRAYLALAISLLTACTMESKAVRVVGGDPQKGRAALEEFDCAVCHSIPGVAGARTFVGPPLDGWRKNIYLAGRFPNEPETLVRWIMNAPALAPDTAMPNLGVGESQARDIAAYLYSLE